MLENMSEFANTGWAWLVFGSSWLVVFGCFWSAWDVAGYGNAYYGWGGRKPTRRGYWFGVLEGTTTGSFMLGVGLFLSWLGDNRPQWSPKALGWPTPQSLIPTEQPGPVLVICIFSIMLLSAAGARARIAKR